MITGIHHVAISVPDLDKAVEFYHGTLGFKKIFANSWNGDREEADQVIGLDCTSAKVQMLKAGNAYLELWEYIEPKPEEQKRDYSGLRLVRQDAPIDGFTSLVWLREQYRLFTRKISWMSSLQQTF